MLTELDFIKAARDPKYMATRWEQRVVMSQRKLEKLLKNPSVTQKEKLMEIQLHKNRIRKSLEMKKKR